MANSPTDFLSVNELRPQSKQQRSRSNSYVDHLEEQAEWDKRDRERQMKRYREGSQLSSTTHHRTRSDHLCVPIVETNRRPRSSERTEQKPDEYPRNFRVENVRPGPKPIHDCDLNTEPVLPSQLRTKDDWKPPQQQQSKPKIKVQIHQDTPSSSRIPSARTPKRSPSASPKSPTAQPELQYQYSTLQAKLQQIGTTCLPYKDIMPADPRDLTFDKIAGRVDGFAFDLHGLAMVEKSRRNVADAVLRNLGRLTERVSDLHEACATAKPKDLKLPPLPSVDDDEGEYGSYNDGNEDR